MLTFLFDNYETKSDNNVYRFVDKQFGWQFGWQNCVLIFVYIILAIVLLIFKETFKRNVNY